MWILWKLVKAINRDHFFGNEGKDKEQQKYFTVNNKQYMVHTSLKQWVTFGGKFNTGIVFKYVYKHFTWKPVGKILKVYLYKIMWSTTRSYTYVHIY